ncbi:MAG: GSCFA domain protein [Odoribacter sp.]|nr:GSCFA domain protein [Odoribacter sp.]
MNLRTTFNIDPSAAKINYMKQLMFIGSCFASEIGSKMKEGKMKVLINPSGVVYNPVSVGNTIEMVIENRIFTPEDLYKYKRIYLSFLHYTDFNSEDVSKALEKINTSAANANLFLKQSHYLFITLGTARIYRFTGDSKIVSNCHKLPSSFFLQEMLTVEEIVSEWIRILDRLHSFNKELRVIFTVSPVRHWKDGAHTNQVSKSILFLAIEQLLKHRITEGYFPAYELLMDDLRDYRYYAEDMLHPSKTAVDYIWKAFSDCYFTPETFNRWKEVQGITRARNHLFLSDSLEGKKEFANNILKKIYALESKIPSIDFTEEKSYFLGLIS